jgi:ribosomal protein S27E
MGEVLQFPSKVQETEGIDFLPIAVGAGLIVATKTVELALCPPISGDELTDCPEVSNDPTDYAPEYLRFNADSSPWLRNIRLVSRHKGEALHASRREQVFEGNFEDIPLDVDAMGTAEKVAKIRDEYGEDSPQYKEVKPGLTRDYARKVAEAIRNGAWEKFGRTVQEYVPDDDELYADGLPVGDMINNGITPVAIAEELDLRINDKVTYDTTKHIIKTPEMPPTVTLYIKPCPNYAHESLKKNPKSAHGGYSPAIDKLMINLDSFNTETQEVYHDQLGVSGKYITPEVMQEVLFDLGIIKTLEPMSRTEIHATLGILQGADLPSIDVIIGLLDKKASEKSGKNIFIGDVVPEDHPKDYQIIYTESEMRRLQQVELTDKVVEYVEKLQEDGVDHAIATQLVEKYIQDAMLNIVEADPSQAEIIFDKPTAERFHRAQELKAQGRTDEAAEMIAYARKNAPAAGSCGAGSCGLELGANLSPQVLSKLQVEAGDTVLIDTERPCNSCGNKTVVYAFNTSKVNKYCTSCDAFESTQTGTGKTWTNKVKDLTKVLTGESELKESKPGFKGGLLELFGVQSIEAPKQERKLVEVGV